MPYFRFGMSVLLGVWLVFVSFSAKASDLLVSTLKDPIPAAMNGGNYLVYELLLENRGTSNYRVKSLSLDGGAFGKKSFGAQELKSRFNVLGTIDYETVSDWLAFRRKPSAPLDPMVIPAGRSGIVFLELSAEKGTQVPSVILNEIKFESLTPFFEESALYRVPVNHAKPLVLAAPFDGGLWFPFNAPSDESAHRRSVVRLGGHHYIAQRFAIDWMRIGLDGRILHPNTSSSQNASYYSYGTPVYAVADATVSKVMDDLPENTPDVANPNSRSITINLDTVTGNSVILDIGDRHYALYAHLIPGSLQVKEGDRVKRGQVIGLLGNSGNSTGPHLHFHVCDGPSALQCQGVPYVVEEFSHQVVIGEGEDYEHARYKPLGEPVRSTHELIWNNREIHFPQY